MGKLMKPNCTSWFQDSLWTQRLKNSWRPMNDLTEHPLLKSQQRSSSAPSVSDSALPDWVCRATRESIDDPTTHSLLQTRRTTTCHVWTHLRWLNRVFQGQYLPSWNFFLQSPPRCSWPLKEICKSVNEIFWNEVFMDIITVKTGQSWCVAVICRKRSAFEMQFHLIIVSIVLKTSVKDHGGSSSRLLERRISLVCIEALLLKVFKWANSF